MPTMKVNIKTDISTRGNMVVTMIRARLFVPTSLYSALQVFACFKSEVASLSVARAPLLVHGTDGIQNKPELIEQLSRTLMQSKLNHISSLHDDGARLGLHVPAD